MFGRRKQIHPTLDGFDVPIFDWERDLLASIGDQLETLLRSDDIASAPMLERLFPPAYNLDAERNHEYQRLMREDLLERHLDGVRVLRTTIARKRLTAQELNGWMRAVNSMRLVLGTLLDVSEDEPLDLDESDDGPRTALVAHYHYLSALLGEIVDAASGAVFDSTAD